MLSILAVGQIYRGKTLQSNVNWRPVDKKLTFPQRRETLHIAVLVWYRPSMSVNATPVLTQKDI